MADRLIRNWWALGARGALALLFGLLTLTWRDITVGTFVGLFIAYALLDGVLTLLTAARYRTRARDVAGPRDLVLMGGVGGTTMGLVALVWPDATVTALLAIVAAWALVTGAPEVALAIRGRRRLPMPALLAAAGAAHVSLAVVLLGALMTGAVRVGWEISAATIAAVSFLLALGLRARGVTVGAQTSAPREGGERPDERPDEAHPRGRPAAQETPSGVAA